ncbi:MAG: zinc ribbon domain-containing protein [Pirellulales bacterium]|nr:zinc ribbon domain-containing protein [Pirellulales bacterium]
MPIYEFYCADCHTIYNFLARRVDTTRRPACPRCGRQELERRPPSRFSISRGERSSGEADELPADFDETKMERLLAEMEAEGGELDEENPRQMAQMMRKLSEATGMNLGKHMEEAMRRMEAGEDPDKIEQEMGDLLESEEPTFMKAAGGLRQFSRKLKAPKTDPKLYDL